MTPVLVLLFKVDPRVAIASDLVNSLAMKPVGGAVHAVHGSVNWALVRLLVVGGVPAAFIGAWTLNQLGDSAAAQAHLKTVLGWALVVACASLVTKMALGPGLPAGAAPPPTSHPGSSSLCPQCWWASWAASWSGSPRLARGPW